MASTLHTFAFLCVVYARFLSGITVTTKYGEIQGLDDNGVSKFLGIPYATPMRLYEGPSTLSNFTGTYNAMAFKPACPQDGFLLNFTVESLYGNLTKHLNIPTHFSEDCLYLNIYAPGSASINSTLPVMVYIHGGGFETGSGQIFDPTELVKIGNVIVVTFNYKLGALGFLSILNNTGLWDQRNALHWVQENVKAFGGNPDMVTIFGEGSGGVAVGLHVVSQQSRGLFKRAISMGGNALQTKFLNMKPEDITHMFMETIGCSAAPDMHECFKNVTVEMILDAQKNLSLHKKKFVPFIDGTFLTAVPRHLIEAGQLAKVDYIVGFNNDAGTMFNASLFMDLRNGISEAEYHQRVHELVMVRYTANQKAIFDTIIYEYRPTLSREKYSENQIWLRQYMTILRDVVAAESHDTELYHAKFSGKVYAYYFDQIPPFSEHSPLMLMAASGVEMAYVFGLLGNNALSQQIMHSWSNFATHGDPTLSTETGPWPLFNGTTKQFVQFNNNFNQSSKVVNIYPGDLRKRLTFWRELLPVVQSASPSCEVRPTMDDNLGSVIALKQGLLLGERIQLEDYAWEQFLDIPYAEPPIGAYRWMPPRPHGGWSGIRHSSKLSGKSCPQTSDDQYLAPGGESEDCLNLDVFVPRGDKYRNQKLPVMIFIHGGGFTTGNKLPYTGAALTQYGVIVVVIQYRLGILGFLSTGDKAAPGNYGLMDQHLAIRWTNENIGHFGGDSDKITIFGESAGAAGVMLQMLSPKSKGLFKNVIAESGSTTASWALDRYNDSYKLVTWAANKANCSSSHSQLIIECLRKSRWQDISRINLLEQATTAFPKPVVDGDFLPKLPELIYEENTTSEFNLMTGTNKDEGYAFLAILSGVPLESVGTGNTNNKAAVSAAFKYTYADLLSIHNTSTEEYLMGITDLLTDAMFAAGADRDAKMHSKHGGKTYRYLFKFKPLFSFFASNAPSWVQGTHADEVPYVFGGPELVKRKVFDLQRPEFQLNPFLPNANLTFREKDLELSRNMMALWTNFASTGDPNKGLNMSFNWPLFTESHPDILLLSENLTQPGHNSTITPSSEPNLLRPDKVSFWNELVPSLEFKTQPPCPGTTPSITPDMDTDPVPTTTTTTPYDGDNVTDKPTMPCNQKIGILQITGEEANIALWVLGIGCGVLLLVLFITCCKCMIDKRKYNKMKASFNPTSGGHDNIAMVRER